MKLAPWMKMRAAWLLIAALVELASFATLKVALTLHPSDNPLVTEYMRRGHPLFADNEDLRQAEQEFAFHPLLGYTLVAEKLYVRPHHNYVSHLETDALGFVHNGDAGRNPRMLGETASKAYRIVFLGGSTMFGLGASGNATTSPSLFEGLVRQEWPGVEVVVVNAGVMGYQSTQERLYYELFLSRLRPDAVIALDGVNDAMLAAELPVWRPHSSSSMLLTEKTYLGLFKPAKALATFARNLLSFPEPLYSLALLRRTMARLAPAAAANKPSLPATYHPEAAEQLADNLEGIARQLAVDHRLGLFALQPYLGYAKAEPSAVETSIMAGYGGRIDIFNHHFSDFADRYAGLERVHGPQGIHFVDLRRLFAEHPAHIYESIAHYNDEGDRVIAQALFETMRPRLAVDLAAKGWLK